jgi:hypothetical protein
MKKAIAITSTGFIIFLTVLLLSCNSNTPATETTATTAAEKVPSEGELLERGKYLVTIGGCNHCHTPKKMGPRGPVLDSSKLLSGHPAGSPLPPLAKNAMQPGNWISFAPDLTATVGPWGISYAANLTPDSATGTGMWTEEVFAKTLRTGKHLGQEGGRPIMPPMPWEDLGEMTDADMKALFTFLKSLPAISNRVPAYTPPNEMATAK